MTVQSPHDATDQTDPDGSRVKARARWLLPTGFLATILLLVLVTAIGLVRMADMSRQMADIVHNYNVKTDLVQAMYTAARERSVVMLSMVSLEDAFDRDEEYLRFNELATEYALPNIELRKMQLNDRERAFLEMLDENIRVNVPLQVRVVELASQERLDEALDLLLTRSIPAQDRVLLKMRDMLEYQRGRAREAFATAEGFASTTSQLMTILALVAVALSATIATLVIRKARGDERALLAARDYLEDRVAERTRELSSANDDLMAREAEIHRKNQTLETLSSQLAKYLSPQVYDSIFTGQQRVSLESKRRKLTIFFSDIVGFTELTDKIESEDLTQLLNRYLTEMSEIALAHGATIDKFIGDAMMVFFGDPESRGVREDALACVKMAVVMQQRVTELAGTWQAEGITAPLACRMGIHTGYCTVGNFGSEDRMDYTAIGGAVNLASRLEAAGEEGGILISHDTWSLVRNEVHCEAMGPIDIRGQAYPVETYRVLGLQESSGETDSGHALSTPHLRLELDLERMDDAERALAAQRLSAAIEALKR